MTAHVTVRLLHDLGAAAWFGGSLMGATGLNAAAAALDDPRQRASASTAGWSRWAPVGGAAVLAHVAGAAALTKTDAGRLATQRGVARTSTVKTGLTAAGLAVSGWSLLLNRKMAAAGPVPVQGATEPSAATPAPVAAAQRQLKVVQWLNPLLAGAIIGVGSAMSEQQRPNQVAKGVLRGLPGRTPVVPAVAVLAAVGLAARKRRARPQPVVDAYPAPASMQVSPASSATTSTSATLASATPTSATSATASTVTSPPKPATVVRPASATSDAPLPPPA